MCGIPKRFRIKRPPSFIAEKSISYPGRAKSLSVSTGDCGTNYQNLGKAFFLPIIESPIYSDAKNRAMGISAGASFRSNKCDFSTHLYSECSFK